MLIKILIICFTFLIGYHIFLALFSFTKKDNLIEGLENKLTNDPNNTLIMTEQNAKNIELVKTQLDRLSMALRT
jgi:hypothetical protein